MRRQPAVGPSVLSLVLLLASAFARVPSAACTGVHVTAVDSVGMTVADMDRAVAFYTSVLTFEKVSDVEVSGREYELMTGVFGARLRIVRLRLGRGVHRADRISGAEGPADPRRSARQRSCVPAHRHHRQRHGPRVRSDCASIRSSTPRPGRSVCRSGTRTPAASRAFYFRDPDRPLPRDAAFPPGKALEKWHRAIGCSSASITPRSSSTTPTRA